MKKLLILLLMSLTTIMVNATDSGKNITITKGQTITIDLASDLGITIDYYKSTYITDQSYTVSDNSAFSIIPHEHIISSNYSGRYYTYDITARKTGNYTFCVKYVLTKQSYTTSNNTYTYNFTIVDVKSISIPTSLSLSLGESYTFSPIIVDTDAETTLTWSSSNTSVATIDSNGKLTTKGTGTTTIICAAHNGVTAQCLVSVNSAPSVPVTSITLNKSEAELAVGDQLQLSPTVKPTNATDKSLTWSSSNEAVAVVNESGKVYAVGKGFSQIKATANDGSGKTASCMVTVKDKVAVDGDMNGDGEVTVTDAVIVIEKVLNKQ